MASRSPLVPTSLRESGKIATIRQQNWPALEQELPIICHPWVSQTKNGYQFPTFYTVMGFSHACMQCEWADFSFFNKPHIILALINQPVSALLCCPSLHTQHIAADSSSHIQFEKWFFLELRRKTVSTHIQSSSFFFLCSLCLIDLSAEIAA